tara:strand:- start:1437 stop:2726 length:1290 start_codon:yes stop_codon:yes gene_type:complete
MKICFIDTWTVGLENLAPVHHALKKYEIDSFLIHTSSFDDENYPQLEEVIKGVNCKEIKYYNTKLIHKALKIEKPDVVLNLTSFYILDRAINYSCKALGIKSVFLMPGTRETDFDYIKNEEYNYRFKQLNNQRFSRFYKYFRFIIPNYFYSIFKYKFYYLFKVEPWRSLLELLIDPASKAMYPRPTREIHADKALVFSNAYKNFFKKMYGYPEKKLFCVGNPKLDDAFSLLIENPDKKKRDDFKTQYNIPLNSKILLYLTSSFVESGYPGWSRDFRIEEFKKIEKICIKNSFHLVIKLHPSMFYDKKIYEYGESTKNVTIIDETNTPFLAFCSNVVVGHSSSTLLIPIVLKKPLIIMKWPSCSFVNDRFSDYEITKISKNEDDFSALIKNYKTIAKSLEISSKRKKYIKDFIQFEDNKSMTRIVNQIIN